MASGIPTCAGCARYSEGQCSAYPLGIPNAILYAQADHRLALPGDGGIQFEPIDEAARRLIEGVWGETPQTYTGAWPGRDPNAGQ